MSWTSHVFEVEVGPCEEKSILIVNEAACE